MEVDAEVDVEVDTVAGPIPLPLERDGEDLAATFRLDGTLVGLRIAPVEGETLALREVTLARVAPWSSLLPDWRIGPLALPPRPLREADGTDVLPAATTPPGWDRRLAVDAVEAARLAGTSVETRRAGVLRIAVTPPLRPGRHVVEGRFLASDGGDARVVPRLLIPGAARDPKDGVRLTPLGAGRYAAAFTLAEATGTLLLRPREERGSIDVRDLAISSPLHPAVLAIRTAAHLSSRRRARRAAPVAIPPAPARLAAAAVTGSRAPLASIVTPTRDAPRHLERFLDTVWRGTRVPFELVLVDNGTVDPPALALLAAAAARPGVTVLRDPRPFNFAALANLGAGHGVAPVLVLANNDVEFPDAEWLAPLVDAALNPRVGVAGARLIYPGGRIQHDGLVLAGEARVEHAGRNARATRRPPPPSGYARPVTAVTGALMAIRSDLFASLGGMRADRYPVLCNDVDLCLRATRGGRLAVVVATTAIHHESATIGPPDGTGPLARGSALWRHGRAAEADNLRSDWADVLDGRTGPAQAPRDGARRRARHGAQRP